MFTDFTLCRFLLARLTFDSLVGHKSPKAIKATLNTLSGGAGSLDSAYDDAMKRIEQQDQPSRELAIRTLLWISQGKRLLSVAEMQQAVAIELGESDLDPDSTVDCDDIISACTGLVTRGHTSCGCEILRLVHYTTQEYLERTTAKYFPKAQQYLASTCLTYLLFDVFSGALCPQANASKNRVWDEAKEFLCFGCRKCWTADQHKSYKNPDESLQVDAHNAGLCRNYQYEEYSFYAYAAWYWGDHAENFDDEAIRIMTERFLDDHKRVSGALHFVRYGFHTYEYEAFKLEESNPRSAMQLAAFLGLTKIMSERLDNESEPDVKDWSGATPLFWAACRGHEDVVRLLTTHENVNPNVSDRYGKTPLMEAVQERHIAIVQRLLAFEYIEINAQEHWDQSALTYAIRLEQNSTQILKLLLACDNIDVNLEDKGGRTPLMVAVESGNEEAIPLLLAHRDIQVNKRNWRGRTALNIAAVLGNTIATQLLLAHGDIQVNIRDNKGQTALHLAAKRENAEAMRLLLAQEDTQANIRDNKGQTALHLAAKRENAEAMRLLLAQEDTQVNIRDNKGSTALHVAVKRWELWWELELLNAPKIDVAELFLARGDVDVNLRDMDGYSPLYHAVHSGEPDVVQLLLTREDLEISVEDGEVGRLVSVAEDLQDLEREGKRSGLKMVGDKGRLVSLPRDTEREKKMVDAYNAIIILLRSYVQQRSSNTTSANLRQRIPERLAHNSNDNNDHEEDDDEDGGDAAYRTNNVEVIEE